MKSSREDNTQRSDDAPAPFFAGGGRQHILNEIEQVLALPGRHILLVGDVGVGKSTLLDELSRRVADDQILCRLEGDEPCDIALVVRKLAQATGEVLLEASGVGELLEVLDHLALLGRRVLLIGDDAGQLPAEVLESLSALVQAGSLHLLLATDAGGAGRVSAACPDVAFTRIPVGPLERQALERYIYFRLSCNGRDNVVLGADEIDGIDAATGGVPAAVDARLSQLAPIERQPAAAARGGFPRRHLIGAGLIAALVLVGWLLWPGSQRGVENGYVTRSLTLPVPGETAPAASQADVAGRQEAVASGGAAATPQAATSSSDSADAPPGATAATASTPEATPETGNAAAATGGAAKRSAGNVTTSVSAPDVATAHNVQSPAPKPQPKPESKPTPKAASRPPAAPGAGAKSHRARPATRDRYAVQLMGTRSRAGAERFVASHRDLDNIRYRTTVLNGKPWYVVLTGSYASLEQARSAVGQLPEVLRKLRPWPRKVPPAH